MLWENIWLLVNVIYWNDKSLSNWNYKTMYLPWTWCVLLQKKLDSYKNFDNSCEVLENNDPILSEFLIKSTTEGKVYFCETCKEYCSQGKLTKSNFVNEVCDRPNFDIKQSMSRHLASKIHLDAEKIKNQK